MCDCERALALLSARLDGALGEGERAELEAHLAQCEDCRAAADALAEVHAVMPELIEEVPEGFHRRVMEQIAAEKIVAFPAKKKHASWKSWASMAAVFAVILLGANGLDRLTQTKSGGAVPMSVAPAGAESILGDTADEAVPRSTPPASAFGGKENAPKVPAQAHSEDGTGTTKNIAPADMGGGAPTPAPSVMPPDPGAPEPQMQVRTLMTFTPEQAGALVAEEIYPGMAAAELRDAEGNYIGFRVALTDESLDVQCLGLTPNGAYYEFYVVDSRGEENCFAAGLDGASVETLAELGQEDYEALVGAE